jgi:hypothetical protein
MFRKYTTPGIVYTLKTKTSNRHNNIRYNAKEYWKLFNLIGTKENYGKIRDYIGVDEEIYDMFRNGNKKFTTKVRPQSLEE